MRFANLFPAGVVVVSTETDVPAGALYDAEATQVRNAVAKRQHEFTVGRLYARIALRQLGVTDYPLLSGAQREPLWPPGVVGSITHCDRFCGVAAARAPIRAIGIDAETRDPMPHGIEELIYLPRERRWLDTARNGDASDWPKLVFSAKESVYKCLFPLTGVLLDFRDVEITVAASSGDFTATVNDAKPLPPTLHTLRGRYVISADHVYTAVIIA